MSSNIKLEINLKRVPAKNGCDGCVFNSSDFYCSANWLSKFSTAEIECAPDDSDETFIYVKNFD